MEKVPFIQLRAISNFVGERDKSKWEINKAIGQLNSQLQQLLSKDFIQ
jgi:futalosine hydrolase